MHAAHLSRPISDDCHWIKGGWRATAAASVHLDDHVHDLGEIGVCRLAEPCNCTSKSFRMGRPSADLHDARLPQHRFCAPHAQASLWFTG